MRKVFAIAAMGLLILSVPALAVVPPALDPFDGGTSGSGGPRSTPCPGTVIWDYSGAGDCNMPPSTCPYVGNMALCFVNADTTGSGGFPEPDRREMAGQWIATDASPLTHVKVWYRFNTAGHFAFLENNSTIHGWCVKVWEANSIPPCPDGSIPGPDAGLGVKVYDQYAPSYTWEMIRGLADDPACGTTRHFAYCITLPVAFYPVADKTYWIVATPDEDCYFYTITDPTYSAYSYYIFNYMRMAQNYARVYRQVINNFNRTIHPDSVKIG